LSKILLVFITQKKCPMFTYMNTFFKQRTQMCKIWNCTLHTPRGKTRTNMHYTDDTTLEAEKSLTGAEASPAFLRQIRTANYWKGPFSLHVLHFISEVYGIMHVYYVQCPYEPKWTTVSRYSVSCVLFTEILQVSLEGGSILHRRASIYTGHHKYKKRRQTLWIHGSKWNSKFCSPIVGTNSVTRAPDIQVALIWSGLL